MNLAKKLVFALPLLLVACVGSVPVVDDDGSKSDQSDELKSHFEIEIVGDGRVVFEVKNPQDGSHREGVCEAIDGLCSLRIPHGSELVVSADFSDSENGFREDCFGQDLCVLTAAEDFLVVADFTSLPETVVDTVPADPRAKAHQPATRLNEEL